MLKETTEPLLPITVQMCCPLCLAATLSHIHVFRVNKLWFNERAAYILVIKLTESHIEVWLI